MNIQVRKVTEKYRNLVITDDGSDGVCTGFLSAHESYNQAMDLIDAAADLMFDDDMAKKVRDLMTELELDWDRRTDPMPHEGGRV